MAGGDGLNMRPVFALLTRAFAEDARSLRTHLIRTSMLALILIITAAYGLRASQLGAAGLTLFKNILSINCIFLTLAAVAFVAPAIAEEREEQTLVLLRMTKLSPLAILLGKGISRGLALCALLLLQIPLVILTVTLGGVSTGQVETAYFSSLAFIVLLTCSGLFLSVIFRRTSTATTVMAIIIGAYVFGPFVYELVFMNILGFYPMAFGDIIAPTPFGRLAEIEGNANPLFMSSFETSWIVVGVVLFGLSWFFFDKIRSETPRAPARLVGTAKRFSFFMPESAWRNALAWKDFNFIAGGHFFVAIRLVAYGLIALLILNAKDGIALDEVFSIIALITILSFLCIYLAKGRISDRRRYVRAVHLISYGVGLVFLCDWLIHFYARTDTLEPSINAFSVILVIEAALAGSRIFATEIRDGTWSSLALLPCGLPRVVGAKLAGFAAGLVPLCAFLVSTLVGLACFDQFGYSSFETHQWIGYMLEGLFFVTITILISLYTRHGIIPIALMAYFLFGFFCVMTRIDFLTPDWPRRDVGDGYIVAFVVRFGLICLAGRIIMRRLKRLATG